MTSENHIDLPTRETSDAGVDYLIWKALRSPLPFEAFRDLLRPAIDYSQPLAPDAAQYMLDSTEEILLHANPFPFIKNALRMVRAQVVPNVRPRVNLVFTKQRRASATSRRRRPRCLGYLVEVHQHLYQFLHDVSEMFISQLRILSKETNEMVVDKDWDWASFYTILTRLVQDFVENKGAWSPPTEFALNFARRRVLELYRPSTRRKRSGTVVMSMVVFVLAHELGHILKGHCDSNERLDQSASWKEELEADAVGAALWASTLMHLFDRTRFPNLDEDQYNSLVRTNIAGSASAVALLFGVLQLAEKAAKELGRQWADNYPPARTRYEQFRYTVVHELKVSELWFSHRVSDISPPDDTEVWMSHVENCLSWKNADHC